MSLNSSEEVARELLNAEREEDVTEILDGTFFESVSWSLLGGTPNNASLARTQSNNPIPALMELIVNSYDAVLLKKFEEADIEDTFEKMEDAAEELLDGDEEVILQADGDRPRDRDNDEINFTLIDSGCGQPSDGFEDAFLQIFEAGAQKQKYSFLQGEFGMGSAASLQFAGENGYKLICSASHNDPEEWSWTIIRRAEKGREYEYATIDGSVPTFEGELDGKTSGSFVKVYNYRLDEGKQKIWDQGSLFKRKLESLFFKPIFPLTMADERYDGSNNQMKGLYGKFQQYSHLLETDNSREWSLNYNQEGFGEYDLPIEYYTLKTERAIGQLERDLSGNEKEKRMFGSEHDTYTVLYTVNGQTHGHEPQYFLTSQCNLPRVGKDTVVVVELDNLLDETRLGEFVLTASRDRLMDSSEADDLRDTVKEYLQNDTWLKDEEETRREAEKNKLGGEEDEEAIDESFRALLERNPQLEDYMNTGEKAGVKKTPNGNREVEQEYESPATELKIVRGGIQKNQSYKFHDEGENGIYEQKISSGGKATVHFWVDAPNGYLVEGGKRLKGNPANVIDSDSPLNNGLFTVTINDKWGLKPDEEMPVNIIVRDDRIPGGRLNKELKLVGKKPSSGSSSGNTNSSTRDTSSPTVEDKSFADTISIRKDDWENVGGTGVNFGPHDVVHVDFGGTISDSTVYINLDCAAYQNYLDENNFKHEKATTKVRQKYKIQVSLLAVCQYLELQQSMSELNEKEVPIGEVVRCGMNGMVQGVLTKLLTDEELERWTQ